MKKNKNSEKIFYTSKPNLWIGFHLLAMKYQNMNKLQKLIFIIKSKIFKPKLKLIDHGLLNDCTFIQENIKREDRSYNESIKEYFNAKS